jgi:feruloyl esterase
LKDFKTAQLNIKNVTATYNVTATVYHSSLVNSNNSRVQLTGLNYCNISITYGHPGWNDTITITSFLPANYNHKLVANGGDGYESGSPQQQIDDFFTWGTEFMHITTNAGHRASPSPEDPWPLAGDGTLNDKLVMDFAIVALHELAIFGKILARHFYGGYPAFSYFSGASGGGLQGHNIALHYPNDFNGILAVYPALYWSQLIFTIGWPAFQMDQEGYYPPACEIKAITAAFLKTCDPDGLSKYAITSHLDNCIFDIKTIAGTSIECTPGNNITITDKSTRILEKAWSGVQNSTGHKVFQGYAKGSDLTEGVMKTECDGRARNCEHSSFDMLTPWLRYFVKQDLTYSVANLTRDNWDEVYERSNKGFGSVMDGYDPEGSHMGYDMTELYQSKTKVLNWHGSWDPIVPAETSTFFFSKLKYRHSNAHDFYRLFICPGGGHSGGGLLTPVKPHQALINWVEVNSPPDTLEAVGVAPDGREMKRRLCLYPKKIHLRLRRLPQSAVIQM